MERATRLSWNGRPLRALEAIARLGSVSAAAAELGYTQSAASQQLAALEREAGLTLVDRGARPLRLTEAGRVMLRHAQDVLAGFVAMESVLAELHGLGSGGVRLVAFGSALASVVPPVLAEFGRRHPGPAVDVVVAEPAAAEAALRAGAADLAVVYRMGDATPRDGLTRRPLLRDPLMVVMPEGHRLAGDERIAIEALAGVPLVAPSADRAGRPHRLLIERLFAASGATPRIGYEIDDLAGARAMARSGLAVVLMHGLTVPESHPGLVLRPVDDGGEGTRSIEVARLEGRRWPPADALADLLIEHLAR